MRTTTIRETSPGNWEWQVTEDGSIVAAGEEASRADAVWASFAHNPPPGLGDHVEEVHAVKTGHTPIEEIDAAMLHMGTWVSNLDELTAVIEHLQAAHAVLTAKRTGDEPDPFVKIKPFRHPYIPGDRVHADCAHTFHEHGWIDLGNCGYTVCPGGYPVEGERL